LADYNKTLYNIPAENEQQANKKRLKNREKR
jgi:hypothetical protein